MRIESIADLVPEVQAAAEMARQAQQEMDFQDRTYKADESVLTATDTAVEKRLSSAIAQRYPAANILGEETVWNWDPARPYTFAIDPIDGTDVFSQGMPGWCVSVGLLDADLQPVAGIISAPAWGLFLLADVGRAATVAGRPIPPLPDMAADARSNLCLSSHVHHEIDLGRYPGKIRNVGSAALHVCFSLVYRAVIGAVEGPGVHVWDLAGAHAIVRPHGVELVYLDGRPVEYRAMIDSGTAEDTILVGTPQRIAALREVVMRRASDSRPSPPA